MGKATQHGERCFDGGAGVHHLRVHAGNDGGGLRAHCVGGSMIGKFEMKFNDTLDHAEHDWLVLRNGKFVAGFAGSNAAERYIAEHEGVVIVRGGKVVARSRNLRGVMDYARKSYVREAWCNRNQDGGGFVCFTYDDGSRCRTTFADYGVLLRWVRSRRSWALHECYCSPSMTSFFILPGDARY